MEKYEEREREGVNGGEVGRERKKRDGSREWRREEEREERERGVREIYGVWCV